MNLTFSTIYSPKFFKKYICDILTLLVDMRIIVFQFISKDNFHHLAKDITEMEKLYLSYVMIAQYIDRLGGRTRKEKKRK